MQDIKNEEYVTCPRCEKEVYKDAITCPFCNFGIMAWLEGEINENGESVKKSSKQKFYWPRNLGGFIMSEKTSASLNK